MVVAEKWLTAVLLDFIDLIFGVDLHPLDRRNGWVGTKRAALMGPESGEDLVFCEAHVHYRRCASVIHSAKAMCVRRRTEAGNF